MKYYLKKNVGAIIISLVVIFLSVFICIGVNNEGISESDLKIKEYKINLKINKDGSGTFDNYITYDFSNVDYTVIYEDIGYKKGNIFSYGDINGNEVKLLENKQTDKASFDYSCFETHVYQDNQEINLTQLGYSFNNDIEQDTGNRVTSSIYYGERIFCLYEEGFTKDTTFNFKYKINGLVSSYLDIGIINWILSPSSGVNISNLSVNITFENKLSNEDVSHLKNNFYVHGNINISSDINISENGVNFKVNKQKGNQSVEVRMGFKNHLVNEIKDINSYNFNAQEYLDEVEELTSKEFNAYNDRYYLIQTILLITLPLSLALIVYLWFNAYKKYDKERVSLFDSEYYRELPALYPPAELGYLYNFKDTTKNDLSATIMDLIRRGYISIDTNGSTSLDKKPNYIYIYNKELNKDNLKKYELFVLKWYFEHIAKSNTLSLDQIDEYLKSESNAQEYLKDNKEFIKLVREEARKNKFFDEFKDLNSKYILGYIPLVALIIFSLFVQLSNYYTYALIFASIFISLLILFVTYINTIQRRSESGNEDYVRWKAFKNFLENFGRFEDYSMPLIEIWEHYLVYAVSFGIADKVEEQMRLKFKSLGEDKYNEYIYTSNIYYSRSYIYVSRSCNNSSTLANATIAQAQAARSSNGGGSFGGGRSFGGGGGFHGGR